MDIIYKKLKEDGFMLNHRGRTRVSWLSLEVRQIIALANFILRGYENYYSFALNKAKLCSYVYYIIKDTVLRTLASKLSLSTRAKGIKKFGPSISLFDQNNRDEYNKPTLVTKLYKPTNKINLWDFKTKVVDTNIKALYSSDMSLTSKSVKGTLDSLKAKRTRK